MLPVNIALMESDLVHASRIAERGAVDALVEMTAIV